MKRTHPTRNAVLRARCTEKMKRAIAAIARRRHCDESDVVREAVALHISQMEGAK